MKHLCLSLMVFLFISFNVKAQTEEYNLASQNLHKKVRKTRTHYYAYDDNSGGFVLRSITINRYNDDGNLAETFYQYNGSYGKNNPVKKLYNYNSDEMLLSVKDVSDKRGKYSTDLIFNYNRKGNLVKKESVYSDGSKYVYTNTFDGKGRMIAQKSYNKENKLSSETSINYDGKNREEVRTSYSTKDGSISGSSTTRFKNDKKTEYTYKSKYSDTRTTYKYDKENNILKSTSYGKSTSFTDYDYVYDNKDNWIKKHSRSGKYQYFYFREIMFDNGDMTGSSDFDPRFIKQHGNFANVNVVPIKIKESTYNKDKNISSNSGSFSNKKWNFDYVYIKKEVKTLVGDVRIRTNNYSKIKDGSDIKITISFSEQTYDLNFSVTSYKDLGDKYEYRFKNTDKATGVLWMYKKKKSLQDEKTGVTFNVTGLLTIAQTGQEAMGMYLK